LLTPIKTFGLKENNKKISIRKMLTVGRNYGIKPTKDSIYCIITLGS